MARNQPSSSARLAKRKSELPPGYTRIDDVLDSKVRGIVNVMGLVKDYQVPTPTRGTDYKCTITIYDKSIEHDLTDLSINIFRSLNEMPQPTAGDVLVITRAKVQSYRETISLITHNSTCLYLFSALDIPKPPNSAQVALQSPIPNQGLGAEELEYVSWIYHHTDKGAVPDAAAFQARVDQSGHKTDKFCKLENVVEKKFCDVIVNVVKEPYDEAGKTTLWVSDYTENDNFYKFTWDGATTPEALGNSDNSTTGITSKWAGPFGRRSIQITCFESHASLVDTEVQLGDWIRIRNLRIKFGSNGLNLEGALHEDLEFKNRRQIDVLKWDSVEKCDPRLKEAIERKRQYEKLRKKQLKSFEEEESRKNHDPKRKADDHEEPRLNSKTRRTEKRENIKRHAEERDKQAEERLGLNEYIRCENQDQPISTVQSIIEPIFYETKVGEKEVTLTLPFVCVKYRTHVRVVDFRPHKLEDFAVWRRNTKSDILSDNSSSNSESESDDDRQDTLYRNQGGRKIWQWRFALQLEQADDSVKGGKSRFWALVDNAEAQLLTSLDACDLREDQDNLSTLRERLFTLWGDLEEMKRKEHEQQVATLRRIAANRPPPSSPPMDDNTSHGTENNDEITKFSNKPFACCIRQYGVSVRESDPRLADAGEGRRWTRMFALFGTKICD